MVKVKYIGTRNNVRVNKIPNIIWKREEIKNISNEESKILLGMKDFKSMNEIKSSKIESSPKPEKTDTEEIKETKEE